MGIQESKRVEEYKKVEYVTSTRTAIEQIEKCFSEQAWIYAVLDFAVGFGIYEKGCLYFCPGEQKEPILLDWRYLRELRVFNEERELLLMPAKETWFGRIRGRMPDGAIPDDRCEEYFIEECQKLWGKVKDTRMKNRWGWSLLTSDRGTRIWVPLDMGKQGAAAIRVRKFMRVPTLEHQELVYQTDIRMVDFFHLKTVGQGGKQENG